ncbi:Bro-N domain-containing protein [Thermodesulfobacteriota bacterium]
MSITKNNITPYPLELLEGDTVLGNKGNEWWPLEDVCKMLDIWSYRWRNNIDKLDRYECTYYTNKRGEEITVVNEKGIYALILKSQSEKAIEFKRFITQKVIPEYRKRHEVDSTES